MRIEQALGNLVDNAIVHGVGAIHLTASCDGDLLRFEVRDRGPGFPREFEASAFERFARADPGRTGGGAGLGLAIVRAIAAAHGGRATIAGAAVRVEIPAHPGLIDAP